MGVPSEASCHQETYTRPGIVQWTDQTICYHIGKQPGDETRCETSITTTEGRQEYSPANICRYPGGQDIKGCRSNVLPGPTIRYDRKANPRTECKQPLPRLTGSLFFYDSTTLHFMLPTPRKEMIILPMDSRRFLDAVPISAHGYNLGKH
jgi:hypothetical protein